MASSSPSPDSRRRWLRRAVIVLAVLAVLVTGAYFFIRSEYFVRNIVAPRIGAALNGDLRVEATRFRPFSQLELRNVRFQTIGPEPLLTAELVRVPSWMK
jgi:hypothetical protein